VSYLEYYKVIEILANKEFKRFKDTNVSDGQNYEKKLKGIFSISFSEYL